MSNNIQYLLCWYIPFKMGSSQNCLTNSSIYRPVPFNIEVKKFQYHRTYLDIAESFLALFLITAYSNKKECIRKCHFFKFLCKYNLQI